MSEPYHKQQVQLNETNSNAPVSVVQGKLPEQFRRLASGKDLLKEVLSLLRAQRWLFQTLHWQVEGKDYYEKHLLFQRLYEALDEEIDTLAEKLVGYFGSDVVSAADSMEKSQKWLAGWKDSGDPIATALRAEKQLQALLRRTYDVMNQKKELSLGLDDFLMATASAHETHLYLLGQANKG